MNQCQPIIMQLSNEQHGIRTSQSNKKRLYMNTQCQTGYTSQSLLRPLRMFLAVFLKYRRSNKTFIHKTLIIVLPLSFSFVAGAVVITQFRKVPPRSEFSDLK